MKGFLHQIESEVQGWKPVLYTEDVAENGDGAGNQQIAVDMKILSYFIS